MKLLLILDSSEASEIISQYARPLGYELIHYRKPLKAMDNIDEINPSAIIISAGDFPRHWKIVVQLIRDERSKENCPVILLKESGFSQEESSNALLLGVNGIVEESLDSVQELKQMEAILSGCIPANEKRKHGRFNVESRKRFGFLFVNPLDMRIVTGEIKNISTGGISFLPDLSSMVRDIPLNTELNECSLRLDDEIVSPVCRLARTGRMISLEFISFPGKEQSILENSLEEQPLREFMMKGL